jgi:DNA-binding phage protein
MTPNSRSEAVARRIVALRAASTKGAATTARRYVRREAARGVDPLVAQLAKILAREAGGLRPLHRRAGVDRRVTQRWLTGQSAPNVALLRAVLQACGYGLKIVRLNGGVL